MSPKLPDLPLGLTPADLYAAKTQLRGSERLMRLRSATNKTRALPISEDEFGEWLGALADYYLSPER